MRSTETIKKLIKNTKIKTNPKVSKAVLDGLLDQMDHAEGADINASQQNIWSIIMKSKIQKLAVAAIIIVAALVGINQFGGSIDGANVAWAEVTDHIAQADYVHVYYFKCRDNILKNDFEAWYDHGRMVMRGKEGGMSYDDGQILQEFDENNRRVGKGPSYFAGGQTFFEVFTLGLLSHDNESFNEQVPANVGVDFLIYEFDPPIDGDFLESIFITVGNNSLLPLQMKVYHKDGDYDLIVFDYEAPVKAIEFFESPLVEMPNVRGEVVLDGEEAIIDIEGTPGLKQAVVRLHGKHDGPIEQLPSNYRRMLPRSFRKQYKKKGGPIFKLDVYFITDEGYQSGTNDLLVLWLNEARQGGVGSENGELDNWPDGKYRNIKYSPMLKSTEREGVYVIEMGCWLRPETD
ncbi:MAG: hypothetical protein FVQ79_07115 [Planctomycetes bacterium]|nr:hypothetical protein [Planctomycetota bacterium]